MCEACLSGTDSQAAHYRFGGCCLGEKEDSSDSEDDLDSQENSEVIAHAYDNFFFNCSLVTGVFMFCRRVTRGR